MIDSIIFIMLSAKKLFLYNHITEFEGITRKKFFHNYAKLAILALNLSIG